MLVVENQASKGKMNIYVGNLPFAASEDEVRQLFASYGQVDSVALIKDKFSGQPRGFGFVEMPNDEEANAAISGLNTKDFKGRALVVNQARPREERGSGGGGGFDRRGGSGGYRRGGSGQGSRF